MITAYVGIALLAYLLGSIPTGYLVARARGIDIRTVGSGNIGATNAFRVLGKPAGTLVLAVDFLKGLVACAVVPGMILSGRGGETSAWPAIVAALAAVLGHNYTVWLRFRGGKGIATSAGVLSALVPWALLIILTVFIVLLLLTRYVSVGSIAASASLPLATWLTTRNGTLTAVTGAMGLLAIYKHRANIRRLLDGTESRIGRRAAEAAK